MFLLLARVGVSPDLLRNVWRGKRNQTARLCRGTISLHSRRSLRDLQVLFANDRPYQGRKRGAAGGRPGRYSTFTVGRGTWLFASTAKSSGDLTTTLNPELN